MRSLIRVAAVCSLFAFLIVGALGAADWPGWRGSKGGVADAAEMPASLTKDNVLWKIKLPGVGASSPITLGDKVFVTCYAGYGTTISKGGFGGFGKGGGDKSKGGGDKGKGGFGKGGPPDAEQKKLKFLLICLDRAQGKILWKSEIEPKLPEVNASGMILQHGYASSTPVTDGERVVVFFGKSGVVSFDLQGNQQWQADVGTATHMWGSASSPVIYKDVVIVNASIESKSLVGLDRKSGKEIWRVKGLGTCWGSPLLVETKEGKTEVVLSLPGKVIGYDPETGNELWNCQGIGGGGGGFGGGGGGGGSFGGGFGDPYTSSTPVARDGIVYAIGGGGPSPATALAVKAGGRGDVNKTHVLWRQKVGSSTCSPVLSGDQLCWVAGTVTALDIADGKTTYNERVYGNRQEYVSAVAVGDKIIALTRNDGLYILAGGAKFGQLAHLEFEGDASIFNASPAVSNGRIYIRSNDYLYCLGKK